MSDDAHKVLVHMWSNYRAGDLVNIVELARALGWTTNRTHAATYELLERKWAQPTSYRNAIALGARVAT
jgi:hypothetical protein